MSFSELVEAVDSLTIDEQEDFAELLNKRLKEKKQEILLNEIEEVNNNFNSGRLKVQSVDEIMGDLLK